MAVLPLPHLRSVHSKQAVGGRTLCKPTATGADLCIRNDSVRSGFDGAVCGPQAAHARWRRAYATAAALVQQLDAAAAAEQFEEAAALQVHPSTPRDHNSFRICTQVLHRLCA